MIVRRMTILAVAASLLVPLAAAHVAIPQYSENFAGHGCGLDAGRLQAECFTAAESGCAPDYDREYTAALGPQGNWDGGYAAFAPHAGCGLVFSGVSFPEATTVMALNMRTNGQAAPSLTYAVSIFVDGSSLGTHTVSLPPDIDTLVAVAWPSVISAGVHDVRIEYSVVSGPSYANLIVDYVDFGDGCLNLAPVLGLVDVDGLVDGLMGWTGYAYDFALPSVSDPDGDPYTVSWVFNDGVSLDGVAVTRDFALSKVTSLTIAVTDDPVQRCVDAVAKTVTRTLNFVTLPDLTTLLTGLGPGTICNAGETLASTLDYPLLAKTCTVGATVTSTSPAVLDHLEWRVDGATFATSTPSKLSTTYNAASFADGFHTLEVCALAKNDKYGREFCSSRAYMDLDCTNAAPTLTRLSGDGMGGGLVGWKGLAYGLTAIGATDADGDPITIRWDWSDGRVSQGATVLRSFASPGAHTARVTITDDPSLRCPGFPARSVTSTVTFTVVPDWTVAITRPSPGKSCIADVIAPIPTQQPLMAGFCTVRASVVTGDARLVPDALGRVRVDMQTFGEGATDLIEILYDSTLYSTEVHQMDACFRAAGDKYAREFCSAPSDYMNVGG